MTNVRVNDGTDFAGGGGVSFDRYGAGIDDALIYSDAFGAPLAEDCEFNRSGQNTGLPSGWSWVNQGAATYLEAAGAGAIQAPGSTGYNYRGIVRSLPASWSSIVAKDSAITRGGNEISSGICLREAATGKLLTFYSYSTGSLNDLYLVGWTDAVGGSPSVKAGPVTLYPFDRPKYWRIRKASPTSYSFECSHDGYGWFAIATAFDPSAVVYDQAGFLMYQTAAGSYAWSQVYHWMRFR